MVSILALVEPFIFESQINSLSTKLGFDQFLFSQSNKIWLFWRHGLVLSLLGQSDQHLHLQVSHSSFPGDYYLTAVYGKYNRQDR